MADDDAARRTRPRSRRQQEGQEGEEHVVHGIAHVHASFNNTHVTITDLEGNVVTWSSAGTLGFKGSRKGTPFAAQQAATDRRHRGQGVRPALARHPRQGPGQRPRVGHPRPAGGGGRDQVHPGRDPHPAQRLPAAQAAPGLREYSIGEIYRSRLPSVPPRGHEAVPEGRPLLHREVRDREAQLRPRPARQGRPHQEQAAGLRPAAAREAEGEAPLRHAGGPVRASPSTAPPQEKGVVGEVLLQQAGAAPRQRGLPARLRQPRATRRGSWCATATCGSTSKKLNIPSYQVEGGRRHRARARAAKNAPGRSSRWSRSRAAACPSGSSWTRPACKGKVLSMPARDDVNFPIQEQLIVELYSK